VAGAILLVLFLEQLALNVEWKTLQAWQGRVGYKIATGAVLAVFLSFQWLLAFCRMGRWGRAAKALYSWHQTVGVLAPALLFLHSTRVGFGYLVVLCSVYLVNNLLGLVNPCAFPRLRSVLASWTVAHIALSVLLVALAGYHAWTALYYE
jgi:methionine sulfoxide reductase heme-binding subunit